MSETAYDSLYNLVDSNQLELIHIVAPPRSSSTALERVVSNSPDIAAQVNDPWSLYDENREAQTYQYILNRIQELPEAKQGQTVVIKNIADYIPPGEAWGRMTALMRHTIFLVREPLLAMESLMRIMAKEVPVAEAEQQARNAGYASWAAMREEVNTKRDYRPYEDLYKDFFRKEQPIHELPEMQIPVLKATPLTFVRRVGFDTHKAYATAKGFDSWSQLCDAFAEGALTPVDCADLLEENFQYRITGWTAMWQHFNNMPDGASHDVVDATMFRALPTSFLPDVFERAQLGFSAKNLDWGATGKKFNSDYDGDVPYYDKVAQSTGVILPKETSVPAGRFPQFIQESLEDDEGAFDVYRNFLERILSQLSARRRQELLGIKVNGVPIRRIDPVFYDFIRKGVK